MENKENNLEGLTDKEQAQIGMALYLGFTSDEEQDVLTMGDKEFQKFVDDGYENASGEPIALGRGRKRRFFKNADGKAMKMRSEYRDGINGTWNREVFDGYADEDEDFDNLFTKKSRKKLGSGFKKVTKKIGGGIKKAGKGIGKFGKNVGKTIKKGAEAVGKGIKSVGKFIYKGVMIIPRGAYLLLMRINYRGLATKTAIAKDKPKYADKWKQVISKWRGMGGSESKLEKAVNKGKNKKPLLCGKKCKSKLAKKVGSSFTGADGSQGYQLDKTRLNREIMKMYEMSMDEEEMDNVVVTTATATAVGTATAIIGTMAGILTGVKGNKIQEKALKDAQNETNRQNKEFEKMASEKQKQEVELAEKQIKAQTNPKTAIMNNPALSNQEKAEALKVLDDSLAVETETKGKGKKMLLMVGLGLVAVLGLVFVLKKK